MRLTRRFGDRVGRANAEGELGLWERDVIHKLADYEDADEQGLLVRLPCKVGDKIYTKARSKDDFIVELTATAFYFDGEEWMVENAETNLGILFRDIGKGFALTREEAEAALKEG